ncbi:MAG: type VI secretion system Vgr family protein, partial [Myxococcales bacterium]
MIGLAVGATLELFGTALPADAYVLSFSAHEAISQPYRVQVRFETSDDSLELGSCIRTRAVLVVTDAMHRMRYFDGFVERASFAGLSLDKLVFDIELRPRLYALTHRADHRIFQEQSIPDVVKMVFSETGVEPVDWKLSRSHGQREMVVQYGESTLAFLSRLLEEAGIFYYFVHGVDGHRLVLCDSIEGFMPNPLAPVLSLSPQQGSMFEPLRRFSRRRTLRTTAVLLRDYDFEKPGVCPQASASAPDNWPQDFYEYPARVLPEAELKELARVRLAELRSDADVCEGTSSALGIELGRNFSVTGAQHDELDGEYIAISLQTNGSQRNAEGKADFHCSNCFRGILVGAPFSPSRITPRPRIGGHQTVFVTGDDNADQAIFTDNYGRIKVRFHWDRVNQRNGSSSPWVRTSQIPLGGAMVIPRVGWEVSATFFEGDPDRPLVLGRTYNAENAPPVGLPAAKASSSLESMSSPGGAGSNKISMGDSGGSQGFG